jgi:voltage-gated potassium channel
MSNEIVKESFKRRLRRGLNHPITELLVMGAIVASVLLVLFEFSIGQNDPRFKTVELINDLFTYFFIVELSLRFYVEQRKSRFFRKYWLDILAVIPFFRSFRILRVFRLLRLFRFGIIFTRRIARWTGAVNIVKVEYIIVGVSILVVVLMGAFSMRVAEGRLNPDFQTLDRALWFSVMTVIGGEPIGGYPKTSLGRFITATLMMGGLTVFAIFTGTISAVMVNSLKNLKFRPMEIDEIDNHVVLCGWNRAGHLIIDELLHDERFKHVVVISEDEATGKHPIFQKYVEQVFVLTGDYTRVDVLHDAGVERASYAMLLADSSKEGRSSQDRDARTVLAAMLIEKLNKNIYTVVQLLNRDNETSLRQVGVEEIIVSDEYVGNIMATVAKNRGIVSMLDELLTAKHGDQFFKCAVPEEMVGKTVAEVIMDLKVVYDATLIGVDLGSGGSLAETMCVNPPGSLKLEATHQIIIAGSRPI